jgi:recombination protein RecA
MISRLEMEKDADEATVGKVPGIVTRMVKASSPMAFANGTTLCVINQVRANIGGWGPDEDTGGGWALKHVTTMKMQVKKAGGEGTRHMAKVGGHEKPIPVGYKMAVRVQKNKMGPEGVVAEMWFHNVATSTFGPIGFDAVQEIFDFAKRFKLMGSGAGGNYEVEGEKIKGGETKVMEYLRQNPDVVQALREKVLEQVSHLAQDDDTPPDVGSDDPLGMAEMA